MRILGSDKLKASWSNGGDAAFGPGVYFTKMDPLTNSKAKIFANNWRSTLRGDDPRMQTCIEIDYQGRNMRDYNDGSRDVSLYEGEDMSGLTQRITRIFLLGTKQHSISRVLRYQLDQLKSSGIEVIEVEYPSDQPWGLLSCMKKVISKAIDLAPTALKVGGACAFGAYAVGWGLSSISSRPTTSLKHKRRSNLANRTNSAGLLII